LGSGKYLNNSIKKYGMENFEKETIAWCYTKEHLDWLEKFYIQYFNTKAPNGYNLTEGGGGILGLKMPEQSERMKLNNPSKRPEVRKKKSEIQKGEGNPFFGKQHSEESLEKMRQPRPHTKGRKRSDISNLNKKKIGILNPMYGRKHTEEENKRNSKLLSGKNNPRYGKHWSEEERKLISERTKEAMRRRT
jgi:group I intron endonuclease